MAHSGDPMGLPPPSGPPLRADLAPPHPTPEPWLDDLIEHIAAQRSADPADGADGDRPPAHLGTHGAVLDDAVRVDQAGADAAPIGLAPFSPADGLDWTEGARVVDAAPVPVTRADELAPEASDAPALVEAQAGPADRAHHLDAATALPPRRIPRWAKLGVAAAVAFGGVAAMTAARNDDTAPLAARAPTTTSASPTVAGATAVASSAATSAATTSAATTAASTTSAATTAAPTTAAPPTTAAAAPTTPAGPPPIPATDVLATLVVAAEVPAGYTPAQFAADGGADAQGCDLRARVLRREAIAEPQVGDGCAIGAGQWTSALDGTAATSPDALAAFPVVSPREAWRSGAWGWSSAKRAAFASDLADARTLRVATEANVRSRAERDVTGWLPPAGDVRCAYVADWIAVKARWGLTVDRNEANRLAELLATGCPGLALEPWAAAPEPAGDDATATPPTTEPYYLDCADAARRGVSRIPRGAPGFRPALDGNGNGIACE